MLASLLALLLTGAAPPAACDTVVVCPAEYQAALAPWIALRRQEHRIEVVDAAGTADEIRERIRNLNSGGILKFVLLVGDAVRAGAPGALPTWRVPAKVNVLWGSEPEIASDNPYADLDDDGVPDLAIGRLSVASAPELADVVAKILAFEHPAVGGQWQRRINFVAGTSGIGSLADVAVETAARNFLTQFIPAGYVTSMTYADWHSPYCPEPALFHANVVERLQEGCLFWIYMGHGQPRSFDYVRVPQGYYPILDQQSAANVRAQQAPPIALMMACYTGRFDSRDGCLAESLLRAPGGPVAVLASSRVSMPYGMSVLGIELMREYFAGRPATLGQLLLTAKREAALRPRTDTTAVLIDTLGGILNPRRSELAAERLEHLAMFNLLGDPLLGLRHPQSVSIATSPAATPGEELTITGTSPIGGTVAVELVVRRDRLTFDPPARTQYEPMAKAREYQEVYRRANDARLAATEAVVTDGKFSARLSVPAQASGACHVRVFIHDDRGNCALGAADIAIERPAQSAAVGKTQR